jgi:hypothetical protein
LIIIEAANGDSPMFELILNASVSLYMISALGYSVAQAVEDASCGYLK